MDPLTDSFDRDRLRNSMLLCLGTCRTTGGVDSAPMVIRVLVLERRITRPKKEVRLLETRRASLGAKRQSWLDIVNFRQRAYLVS